MTNEKNYRTLLSQRAYWEAKGDTQEVKNVDRSIARLQEKMNEDAKAFLATRKLGATVILN